MKRGLFIAFEGGEAVGKTTQIKLLYDYLSSEGHDVLLTREPGGTDLGEKIRALFKQDPMCERAELLLVEASRAEHVHQKILPALKSGKIVLCDRYQDSSLAYQGIVRGLGIPLVTKLNEVATQKLKPDLIFWIDLSLEELSKRLVSKTQQDRFDHGSLEFHQKILKAYRKLGKLKKWKALDGSMPPEALHEIIRRRVDQKLGKSKK